MTDIPWLFQSIIWPSDDGQTVVRALERNENNKQYRVAIISHKLDYTIINGFDYIAIRTRRSFELLVALVRLKILSDPTMQLYSMVINVIFRNESKHTTRK